MILDVARCYLWLFTLCVDVKMGKGGCYVLDWPVTACVGGCCSPGCRLWCLWWCLFVLSFFLRGVLDGILNLIRSVSGGFPSYFCMSELLLA